jgi:pyridoxal phosphate enzyme (YggS family)
MMGKDGSGFASQPRYSAQMTENAATRLENAREKIAAAAKIAQRKAEDVTLIAISKTHPAEDILPLLDAGQRAFGENRVQEAQGKWPELRAQFPGVELHLVGQLQSNKADDAVALFDCIHSLDRPSLLKALAKAMDKADRRIPCFIQVDIGEEEQKGGCAISDLPAFIAQARAANIPLAGLMCVPPAGIEPTPFFALLDKLAADNGLEELSMGMSGDYPIAVQLGATHVRVGTALFGSRG